MSEQSGEAGNDRKHLVKAADTGAAKATCIHHPLNPKCEVFWTGLSDVVGMQRAQVALGRIPPGKESFTFHAHTVQEEWVYILSGTGEADIGAETHAIGAGDYMGFPIDGTGHLMRNTGDDDLVYLMGGERTSHEVALFPKLGKRLVAAGGTLAFVDESALEEVSHGDFVAESGQDELVRNLVPDDA